jgi:methionine-gamma-lyase
MLEPGDEVLADLTLYGCTFSFLTHGLARFGVTVRHVDMTDPAQLAAGPGPQDPRGVPREPPPTPICVWWTLPRCPPLAHAQGAKVVVDNTYCTPYLQQPLLLGADVSVHSMTKYLGGHGDLTAGAAIFADAELAQHVRLYGLKDMTGAVMSAQDAHLVMRGLKTLALRMDRHCQSAQAVAEFSPPIRQHTPCTTPACPALRSTRWPSADAPVWRHDRF